VLRIHRNGHAEEVFNGPGDAISTELAKRKPSKTGQVRVPLSALRAAMESVPANARLERNSPFA
jgi:hypothetical protein